MNTVIDVLMNHRSVRRYRENKISDEMIQTIVSAGQHAAFASQTYSILMKRDAENNPFKAPLLFYICADMHKFELIMKKRGWERRMCDLFAFYLSMEDASYGAQNMVIAAESLGLGTCYLGYVPYYAKAIKKQFALPEHVFPLVGLTMGYPAEKTEKKPRYPLDFVLFEDKYPDMDDAMIEKAMKTMDEGYLKQDYYKKLNAKIKPENREEMYDYGNYSWTEHISRKFGQWSTDNEELKKQLRICGFDFDSVTSNK